MPLKSSNSKSWKCWMLWRALRDMSGASVWSSRSLCLLQKQPAGEGGSKAFLHCFWSFGSTDVEVCQDSLSLSPSWLIGALKLWLWANNRNGLVHFCFVISFLKLTQLSKLDLLCLLFLSQALMMSYSFLYESQTGPLDGKMVLEPQSRNLL